MPPVAVAALLTLAALWGSAFPAIKLGLDGLSVPQFVLLRHLVASICFVPFLLLGPWRALPRRGDLPILFGLGFVGITVYHLALSMAEVNVSAGAASLIIATTPVLSALLAYLLTDDRLPPLGWLGSAAAFGGVALIVLGDSARLRFDAYALFALLAAAATAVYFVIQKPLLRRYRSVEMVAYTTWTGTVPLLLFLPWLPADLADAGARAIGAAVYSGVVPSAVAYTLFSFALARAAVTRVTAFLYLVPVFSLLLSWWLLGEVPSALMLAGGAVAITGIVVVDRARRGALRPVGGP